MEEKQADTSNDSGESKVCTCCRYSQRQIDQEQKHGDNPFPPGTNAHLNYDFGGGFPPLAAAPLLWQQSNITLPNYLKRLYPGLFN